MPRIGVLADTHIHDERHSLPAALLAAFAGVDAILHAGDIACSAILEALAVIAPVHAVYGNVDPSTLQRALPDRLVLTIGDVRIGLTHGHLGPGISTPDRAFLYFAGVENLQVVVFGHSHVPHNEMRDSVLVFNPGSATQRRRQPWPSFGLLTIEAGLVQGTIIPLNG